MSTLILNGARAAGSALLKTGGRLALNYTARAVSAVFDDRVFEGPRLSTFHLMTSRDGAPMPLLFGRSRLAGQVIWASRLKEHVTEERVGAKGGPTQRNYRYRISFALGLCEGEILSVDRLWANGGPLRHSDLTMRVHKGSRDQQPDPVIAEIEGPDAPAFRETAYIVFEDFPLDDYGTRLPQINAEVTRVPPAAKVGTRLEDVVTGVNLIPASGEFSYAVEPVDDVTGPGRSATININNLSGQTDIEEALDRLERHLPKCRHVSLVVSWFGTDLRAGQCDLRPGVESRERLTPGMPWSVGNDTRATAHLVSRDDKDRPLYGGTPSDESVSQAITSLKRRGFTVSFYPFILMDIPPGNGLPDPYDGTEQGAFPWRGRITSQQDNSPDVIADVDAFYAKFRTFILHYAGLVRDAGGVSRFIIGSELRGLTGLRSAPGQYPFVDRLRSLAGEVKTLTGPTTQLTYAADWSEYFGHHAGDDVTFHLDPLWSDPNIDAVGIDAYWPLSDWRDGNGHKDADNARDIYDLSYLRGNVEGGEGYAWYYASEADRIAQIRTPITDGAYGKPWVFRYKDIRNWWSKAHVNRINGVEAPGPTDWVPESKPIWFTEVGCPAIDKGANRPNVFVDPKSSESHLPYFSDGLRDDLIQRRYIEVFLSYWNDHNAVSSVDGRPMVDMEAAHVWCWDARPFPDFPARTDVWSDGGNWERGHWLTGRTGLLPLADVIKEIAQSSGLTRIDVSRVHGLVEGYRVDRPMSARAALTPLLSVYGVDMRETAAGVSFFYRHTSALHHMSYGDVVAANGSPFQLSSADPDAAPLDVRVGFIDGSRDYQPGSVSARDLSSESVRIADVTVPLVMDSRTGQRVAERLLQEAVLGGDSLSFTLSPKRSDIHVGDRITIPENGFTWHITDMEGGLAKEVKAVRVSDAPDIIRAGAFPEATGNSARPPVPALFVLDIPDPEGHSDRGGPLVGGFAHPFNPITVTGPDEAITLDAPVAFGALLTDLPAGPVAVSDRVNVADILMGDVNLASVGTEAWQNGDNRFAVETPTGFEIFAVRDIELIAPNRWRLSHLLRGLAGTDADMADRLSAGARMFYLGRGWAGLPLSAGRLHETVTVQGSAAGRDAEPVVLAYEARHLRPLSPVHVSANRTDDAGLRVGWIRRTRHGGNRWSGLDVPLGEEEERYRIECMTGGTVSRTFETESPSLIISSEDLAAMPELTHLRLAQGSQAYGWGAPVIYTLESLS